MLKKQKKEVQQVEEVLEFLAKKYGISSRDTLHFIRTKQKDALRRMYWNIPVSLFSATSLSSLEAIAVYLHDNTGLSFAEMSKILGRHAAALHASYAVAKKKFPSQIIISETEYFIPCALLKERRYSVLETIVSYLKKEYHIKNKEISKLLNKDPRTIWTVLQRAAKKGWSYE